MRSGAAAVLLLCVVPAAAGADESAARAHYASGRAYYDQGRYEDALREFEEALREAPDAQKGLMAFNVAQAQERLGKVAEAIASLQQYLTLVPDAEDRPTVEARIQTLQARLTQTGIVLTVSEEGARVFVDGHESGTTPLAEPIRVEPGSHELRVEKEGFRPLRLRVSVEAGRQVETEVILTAIEGGVRAPPRSSGAGVLPWVSTAVAGVAIAGGTVLGVLALGKSADANDNVTGDRDIYDSELSHAETLALFADISFGIAIAAGVTAVVLFVVGGGDDSTAPPSAASVRVSPFGSPQAVGFAVEGHL